MIRRLQRILESPRATGPSEAHAFIGVVMDALIELNARVPAPVLMPYVDNLPVHTFVLLSGAADREDVLLNLLVRVSGSSGSLSRTCCSTIGRRISWHTWYTRCGSS